MRWHMNFSTISFTNKTAPQIYQNTQLYIIRNISFTLYGSVSQPFSNRRPLKHYTSANLRILMEPSEEWAQPLGSAEPKLKNTAQCYSVYNRKMLMKLANWGQFHQHFYERRSQKRNKILTARLIFYAFGISMSKSCS